MVTLWNAKLKPPELHLRVDFEFTTLNALEKVEQCCILASENFSSKSNQKPH
jgi:hypothetical protein